MKVCLLNNLYPPYARGGAERVTEQMAAMLATAGHAVVIITAGPDSKPACEVLGNIKIWRFRPLNFFYYYHIGQHGFLLRLLWHVVDMFNISAVHRIKMILKEEKPDLVITHNLKGLSLLIPRCLRKLRLRHFHMLHDVQLAVPSGLIIKGQEKNFLVSGWLTRFYAVVCRTLFASPEKVISPSRWLMSFYENKHFFPLSEKQILPNPLSEMIGTVAPRKFKTGKYLFIGQIAEHKGVVWLLNLWFKSRIVKELLVVGSGDYDLATLNLPANIKLLGRKEPHELVKYFEEVDYLIVPSLCYENAPTVISLAYSAGVPVIASKIGGITEMVQDGKSGYLFEAGNEISFLQAYHLSRHATDEQFAQQSAYCRQRAAEFSPAIYLQELLS